MATSQIRTRRQMVTQSIGASGVVGALWVTACDVQGGGKQAATGKVGGTLVYRDWRNRAGVAVDDAWWNAVKNGFQAKYPEVKWEQETVPFGKAYIEKFVAAAAADTPQDVVFSSIIWARDFWEQGLLEDLGPYIARTPSVAPNQYIEPALFYNSWKGKTFGVPHVGPDFRVFYVNQKLLREAGIDPSDTALAKWTWSDLMAHHQKLVRRDGDKVSRGGVVFSPGGGLEDFTTYLYTNGASFYNKDRNAVAFNNTQGQQVLEAFIDFRTKARMHEAPEGQGNINGFAQGAVAVLSGGSWAQRDIQGNPLAQDLEYTMMNIPRGPSGKQQATTAWTNMTIMPKNSKNKDTAWAFMEYFHSLPVAIMQFDIWKQASPRKDFLESKEWKDATAKVPSYQPFRRIAETGGPYAYIKNAEIGDQVQPLLREAIVDSKRSVRDALAEAERQANLILSQVK